MKLFISTIVLVGAASALCARADTVVLNDGSVREGTIVRRSDDQLQLRMDHDGLKATITIPMSQVKKITASAAPAPVPKTPAGPTSAPAPSTQVSKNTRFAALPPTEGFLKELLLTSLHRGPDDPARLPADLHDLWDSAVQRDALGNRVQTLEALQQLDDAFAASPGGPERLDGIARRERNEPFGTWLARIHWDVLSAKAVGGQLELKDVRDSERRTLIGILKEKTGPALDPLRTYFPPIDDKTGKPVPFRPTQLQGITIANAMDVKKQAAHASTILLAQLKIEPQMPAVDRLVIGTQLQNVTRILSRANELEPAAKAAAEKAARDRRIAEEKAKHPS